MRAVASRRSTTRRSSPRRCPASTSSAAAAPGTTRTPTPTTRRSTRSRSRPGRRGSSRTRNRGPNPFTPLAIQFWEDAIDSGGLNSNKIAAVGSSDSHNAGRTPDPVTQSPIGPGHHGGVRAGAFRARHRSTACEAGPHLREGVRQRRARPAARGAPAGLDRPAGDHGRHRPAGRRLSFTARVMGAGPGRRAPGRLRAVRAQGRLAAAGRPGDQRRLQRSLPERRPPAATGCRCSATARSRPSRARSTSSRRSHRTTTRPARHRTTSSSCPRSGRRSRLPSARPAAARRASTARPLPSRPASRPPTCPVTAAPARRARRLGVDVTAVEGNSCCRETRPTPPCRCRRRRAIQRRRRLRPDPSAGHLAHHRWRLSDNFNGPNGDQSGTMIDLDFPHPLSCSPTATPLPGSSCAANTSVDATVPNAIKEAKAR